MTFKFYNLHHCSVQPSCVNFSPIAAEITWDIHTPSISPINLVFSERVKKVL